MLGLLLCAKDAMIRLKAGSGEESGQLIPGQAANRVAGQARAPMMPVWPAVKGLIVMCRFPALAALGDVIPARFASRSMVHLAASIL